MFLTQNVQTGSKHSKSGRLAQKCRNVRSGLALLGTNFGRVFGSNSSRQCPDALWCNRKIFTEKNHCW